MNEIKVLSFAKINLSLDVGEAMENGFHQVDMLMQQLSFHDDVIIKFEEFPSETLEVQVKTNRYYLPTDERNLAHKAVRLMESIYGDKIKGGKVDVDILKRIPVAAGLAGGSGNGAAVIHGLNVLWDLQLDLKTICDLCAKLGSDVPFCAMGQARVNYNLPKKVRKDRLSTSCARATGTGVDLEVTKGIRKFVVIAKPAMGVSTAEAYKGIDNCVITERPDNQRLIENLATGDYNEIYKDFINVLEQYTLNAYPKVKELKEKLGETNAEFVMMSGSGPTVFGIYDSIDQAKDACQQMRDLKYEAYWTKTTR